MSSQAIRRAAVYIRMSTDEQVNSPERQWVQIEAYCKRKGYTVVRRYEDLGLRGNDDTRPQFQQLIADASAGKFDVVVVDEQSRLARNDMVAFIVKVVSPLRDAGVVIDTVAKGLVDWDDLGGFIVGAVTQHAASGEVITLSRRVVTELARKALDADLVAGTPPYGYRQVWVDADGSIVHEGRRTWTRRPAGLKPQFAVVDEQAKVVRWLFDAYANQDMSLNGIIAELHRRGIPSPRGGEFWSHAHLRHLFRNRAYVGDWVFNKTAKGNFHSLTFEADGENRVGVAEPRKAPRCPGKSAVRAEKKDESQWVVVTVHHEPLVDRDIFQRVQALLKDNRERRTPKPSRGEFVFSRLLVCGKCGSWMTGDRFKGVKVYLCSGYTRFGLAYCSAHRIREEDVLTVVDEQLKHHFTQPERLERVRAGAREHQRRDPGNQLAPLKKQVATLSTKIATAIRNILLLDDPALVPTAMVSVKEWEAQRLETEAAIAALERAPPVEDTGRTVELVVMMLASFKESVTSAAPAAVRGAVRGCLGKIELDFETVQRKVRVRHLPVGGRTYFHSGDVAHFRLRARADGEA